MKYKAYLVLPLLLGVAMIISWPSLGQEQKGAAPQGKRLKGDPPQKQEPPKAGEKLSIAPRRKADGRRAGAPVFDFWYPTRPVFGAFHLEGQRGRGIFRWLPAPVILNVDTTLTFSHDDQVGEEAGWTYSLDDRQFFLFFSNDFTAYCGYVQYQIMGSYDNQTFFPFACAD